MKIENIEKMDDCLDTLKKIKKASRIMNNNGILLISNANDTLHLNNIFDQVELKNLINRILSEKEKEVINQIKEL